MPDASHHVRRSDLLRPSVARLLPDRHVSPALARERLSCPPGVPFAQPKPRQFGHEVELGRPHVSMRRPEPPDAAIFDVDVMRREALSSEVVLVDPPVPVVSLEDAVPVPHRQPLEVRDPQLDDEPATGIEVRGCVAEARTCCSCVSRQEMALKTM